MELFVLFSYLVTFGCGWLNVQILLHFAPYCATHQTGDVTRMAMVLFNGDTNLFFGLLGVVSAFIIGSAIASFINPKGNMNFSPVYGIYFIICSVGLFVMAIFFDMMYVLNLYCALFAGYQNGFISQFGLRASHLSGTATDAGIELGRFFRDLRKKNPNGASIQKSYISSFALKILTVLVFFSGAMLGVFLSSFMPNLLVYALIAVFDIAISVYYMKVCNIIKSRREEYKDEYF